MRVPYSWLLEFINPGLSPEELADRFTMSGVEVGAVEPFGQSMPGVVVGRVVSMEAHPGRSNLVLVKIDSGSEIFDIVCGARNMKPGDLVPLAKPGSELPGGRRIETATIYGALSRGMICSAHELGLELGAEDEILILNGNMALGTEVDRALGFDDMILHLEITPNRADCLSLLGVAYETAALTGAEVKMPPLDLIESGGAIDEALSISVTAPDLCSRYTARVVTGVKIGPSPLWMQLRLLKAGIRPISNIVDITNYVMWEFGQPQHAFDLGLVKNSRVIVRRGENKETLVTLDGVERKLDREVLVIADPEKPVGLAGVMGGENTEITSATEEVLIEAAVFDSPNTRRTARRYNLPSEASQRFEKGVNPEAVLWSQDRAAKLMSELAGGTILKGVIDIKSAHPEPARIKVDPRRVNRILGLEIPAPEIESIMDRLAFTVEKSDDQCLNVTVPARRADIQIEEDIVEEVARLHGYDKIPITLPEGALLENRESASDQVQRLTRDVITAAGFYECITYSFINPAGLDSLRLPDEDWRRHPIPVQNPFSEEQAVMRTTLLPGMLKTVRHNLSYRELDQALFEVGAVFKPLRLPLEELPDEQVKLAMAVTGQAPAPNWLTPSRDADFFTIKGALETLLNRFQVAGVEYEPRTLPFSHPTRSAVILADGEELGHICQVHPEVAAAWEIDQAVTVAEIDLQMIVSKASLVPRYVPLPRYPAANRDIAIVVTRDIPAEKLKKAIIEAGGEITGEVGLFDLYEGKQIPEGKRSLAFSITFRREEGTLTETEINAAMQKIEAALSALGAELRR